MDKIVINELEVFAHHGVYEDEKEKGQIFVVNATIFTDTITAGMSDQIEDTLDYGKICEFIKDYMLSDHVNLLETLTNELARKLLQKYPAISQVTIEICKPDAPIPMKFKRVSIEVTRGRHTAYISFGSNLGDRESYITNAIANLGGDENIRILDQSDFIETKPYGNTNQADFLNGVLKIETLYSPEELLARLHIEENEAHRERNIHWGPRTLDMDIIFYDDLVMSTPLLIIPHPDMTNREFVLKPLCEIDPYVVHPRFMLTASELLDRLKK